LFHLKKDFSLGTAQSVHDNHVLMLLAIAVRFHVQSGANCNGIGNGAVGMLMERLWLQENVNCRQRPFCSPVRG
jgi:hypothetical protein